jgi:hypothetical protein
LIKLILTNEIWENFKHIGSVDFKFSSKFLVGIYV